MLRQSYANLGWERETLAMDVLVNDIKNKDNLKDQILEDHIQSYRKNREYLLFGQFWFKDKDSKKSNLYKSLLKQRDDENIEKEFQFVIGPFAFDQLEF